ncbi:penicillin acylase family protein [Rhizohabitans arisaemae]|uniref:penicillin acylase family protein n=1 Tax=Rhizohabitans arisaemae TaxID=2720610 RepID=UPI0024B1FCA2|nr:penicillin acylase family protein [Rhizohabitans arisaemae]
MKLRPFARLPWPLRWLARVLVTLLVLTALVAAFAVWTVRESFPQLEGSLTVKGLSGPVTVIRDRYGIPQLYADTPDDLFLAQGYIHAQDRFWEMDFRRKTTAGRLSELFGASTLDTDKVIRTLGWRRTAERELELLDPETRRVLDAYAKGVNAWMAERRDAFGRSLEYTVLKLTNGDYAPEPWTPADSVAWLKAMAWDLRSNMEQELARAVAATAVPKDRVDQLWPEYPYDRHATIVDGERTGSPARAVTEALTPGVPAVAEPALAGAIRAIRRAPSLLGDGAGGSGGIGSNSWVVGGARTTTGKPLLANDPHLAPHMPSLWYQAGLHCRSRSAECPYDLSGFTFAGVPGVIIGRNHNIAWGFTNLAPDVSDVYLERLRDGRYEYKGEWLPVETRTEEIKVAGGPPVRVEVRSTRHGPLISDVIGDARRAVPGAGRILQVPDATATPAPPGPSGPAPGGAAETAYGVTLRWTALEPGRTADAILRLAKAQDWKGFREAAKLFEVPAQNLLYADLQGNIGYQAPGRIPVRTKGDGRWPVPGWTGEHDWSGYIPFDKLPTVYNPAKGYIVTANNAAVGADHPLLLTKDWAYGSRAQRIVDRLEEAFAAGKVDLETMGRIQLDSENALGPVLVPYLLRIGDPTGLLSGWDFSQELDSAPAAYFNAVWRNLLVDTFNDELPEDARPTGGDRWFQVVRSLLGKPDDPWWDDVTTAGRTETRDDVLKAALDKARRELGGDPAHWRWGDLHTLTLVNDTFGTSGIGPVEWLFNRGPIQVGGNDDAVNATGWNVQQGYAIDSLPSMRMLIDLADPDRSRWINLTGASGHAFHDNYWDQALLWRDGKTTPMRAREESVRREAVHTLTLTP